MPAVNSAADRYDVAILGSGMAGGMLGAVLARNGVQVLIIDAGTHPRFAVGESTIPYTSGMMRLIADRYRVPELRALSNHNETVTKVSPQCGQKQNFGFVYHREGEPQDPRQVNQLVVPTAFRTESHLFRQDVDAYLFHLAVGYGAEARLATRITDVDIDPADGAVLRSDRGEEFRAAYVVDGSGYRSPLAERFELRDTPTRARTHSRCLFTHMIGVRPFDESPTAERHEQPNPWSHGTLHHVFDGGWLWVIPFDNHPGALNPLCSVGLTLDPRKYPKGSLPPEREFADFLGRFPEIAWQFRGARAVRPWVSTGRLQYSAKKVVGDRYCLTSHAAGFIDALYSRGLANTLAVVNALGWRLIAASRDGDWSTERFAYVADLQQGLFDFHDDLVYSSFVGFGDYELWNAVNRTWMLGTMSGNMMLEDAHHRFRLSGDDNVFVEAESYGHPGSPLPISESFVRLGTRTRELCEQVEAGALAPPAAAAEILDSVRKVDFFPYADQFGLAENGCYHMTRDRIEAAKLWARTSAPADIGPRMLNALENMAIAKAEEGS